MLQLAFSGCAFERLHCVDLRCECGDSISVDTDNFEEVDHDYVIIKPNVTVTCSKCGRTYTPKDRYIPLEPQIIREEYQPSPDSNLPYWMTRDVTTEELLRAIVYD